MSHRTVLGKEGVGTEGVELDCEEVICT